MDEVTLLTLIFDQCIGDFIWSVDKTFSSDTDNAAVLTPRFDLTASTQKIWQNFETVRGIPLILLHVFMIK